MGEVPPFVVSSFKGDYDRGEEESVPVGFFRASQNIRFLDKGVSTRYGSLLDKTISSVARITSYERIGEAKRLLILNATGDLYDSTNLSTPILSIAGMTDFSSATIFDRAYITPHNGTTGLAGERVYVYNGSGLARPAAGVAPASFTLTAADSATSGKVETGTRVIGVAFLTSSGYVTAPGGFVSFSAVGAHKLDIGNIGLGGAGVVGRVLVSTKIIVDYTGDTAHQTYYIIPDGNIDDNTSTTKTVDFYDADLVEDATFLLEQVSEIPAGVGIDLIGGRMLVWGEDTAPSIIRVSPIGEPESMNAVDGFMTVNPGDQGAGVTNCAGYRTTIVAFKSQRSYITQPDGENPPSLWQVDELDGSIGAECHCVAHTLNDAENVEDRLLVADRRGLRLFDGTFSQDKILSTNIQDIWDRITKTSFNRVEVALDPIACIIYVAVPLDSASACNAILVGDYSNDLSVEGMRWTKWVFPDNPQTVLVDVISKVPVLKFGVLTGNVYKIDTSGLLDYGTAIDSWVQFPHIPNDELAEDQLYNFLGLRARVRGLGDMAVRGLGIDDVDSFTGESITLAEAPGKSYFSGYNYVGERCSIKLRISAASKFFTLTKVAFYIALIWGDRPRV